MLFFLIQLIQLKSWSNVSSDSSSLPYCDVHLSLRDYQKINVWQGLCSIHQLLIGCWSGCGKWTWAGKAEFKQTKQLEKSDVHQQREHCRFYIKHLMHKLLNQFFFLYGAPKGTKNIFLCFCVCLQMFCVHLQIFEFFEWIQRFCKETKRFSGEERKSMDIIFPFITMSL